MEETNLQENNTKKDGNISVPKPLFALILIALCGTLCYASYITGFMKGKEEAKYMMHEDMRPTEAHFEDHESKGAEEQPAADNNEPGLEDIFRRALPFGDKGGHGDANPGNGGADNAGQWNDGADIGGGSNPGNSSESPAAVPEQKAFLGIIGVTVNEEMQDSYNMPAGVMIKEILDDGAADRAEIKPGSIITSCDGKAVTTIEGLKEMLGMRQPGDMVNITLFEPVEKGSYTEKTVSVTLTGEK